MPLITLTIRKKDSKYYNGILKVLESSNILEITFKPDFKTQAEEDAKTPTGTYFEYKGFNTKEIYVVDETPAQIEVLARLQVNIPNPLPTQITDGTDTLLVNPDGSINVSGTVTVPANLVREQAPFNIENDIDVLRQEFQTGVYKNNVVEKQSLCVVRVVVDSPAVGDKTTYLGYNNNDYLSGGSVALIDNTYSIKRVVEFANGDVDMSWADGDRNNYTLIFDDGSQNYLTYGY